MITGICDTPDRPAARLYRALRVECGCCTFVRGVALGILLGVAATLTIAKLRAPWR